MVSELLDTKLAHHVKPDDGSVGAADLAACRTGIAVLNGARGGAAIPTDDRAEVYRHLAEHIREAGAEPPPLTTRFEERPVERRTLCGAEMRVADAEGDSPKRTLVGYAAVFDQPTDAMSWFGFREVVRKGAFANAVLTNDVRALLNHDPNLILGRNKAGTLRLSEDDRGLRIEVDLPETSYAVDLLETVKRGDLDQMSFGFRAVKERWTTNDGDNLDLRELLEVELFDVSPVTFPAYPQTTIAQKRDLEAMADSLRSIGAGGGEPASLPTEQAGEDVAVEVASWQRRIALAQRADSTQVRR
jgi:uncharacterized protein